jgi:hypothetical protein
MTSRFAVILLASALASPVAVAQPAPPAPPADAPPILEAPMPPPLGCSGESCVLYSEPCTSCTGVCGPPGRLWAEADFLLWWMKGTPLPPLVATGPAGLLATALPSGFTTLFGDKSVNEDLRAGGRVIVGGWIDHDQTIGVEANVLFLENRATRFTQASTGTPLLAVPFTDTNAQAPSSLIVASPNGQSGSIHVSDTSTGLVGVEVLFRENLLCGCLSRIDVIGGYRFQQFTDRLGLTATTTTTSDINALNLPSGSTQVISDRFDATNNFHGFDFGLTGEWRRGPWRLKWETKLAVGENFEVLNTNGTTVTTLPGAAPTTALGGIFAGPTVIGNLTRDRSIVIPEASLQLGVQLTRQVRAWVGYTGLYWSEAVWAGKQIETQLNPTLLPGRGPVNGALMPLSRIEATSLWAQGVDFGVEVRY